MSEEGTGPAFRKAAIVGVGLLGASLGLALRARGLAAEVHGAGRREASLQEALKIRAIDSAHLDVRAAAQGADLVVLCTPSALIVEKLREVLPHVAHDAVVTDVGSTKSLVCSGAAEVCPRPMRFVGSHPIAGSEKFGPEHGSARLYDGRWCIVTPQADQAPEALDRVRALWEALGMKLYECSPEEHDRIIARTSHVPHVLAACAAEVAAEASPPEPFIGSGFRDTSRVADGRPEIWRDICMTNRPAIEDGLDAAIAHLEQARQLVRDGDAEGLHALFAAGHAARQKVLHS